jgi:hypothetical protein
MKSNKNEEKWKSASSGMRIAHQKVHLLCAGHLTTHLRSDSGSASRQESLLDGRHGTRFEPRLTIDSRSVSITNTESANKRRLVLPEAAGLMTTCLISHSRASNVSPSKFCAISSINPINPRRRVPSRGLEQDLTSQGRVLRNWNTSTQLRSPTGLNTRFSVPLPRLLLLLNSPFMNCAERGEARSYSTGDCSVAIA